jgi:hypothetical protein
VRLFEGKKETVANRLIYDYPNLPSFINKVLDIDPTGQKYVEYIGKQLLKILPKYVSNSRFLSNSNEETILDMFELVIPWFHENSERITQNDIEALKSKYDSSNIVVDNMDNIAKSFKDINQYVDMGVLKDLMMIVNERKTEKEKSAQLKSQVVKIYEDGEVLVVNPKTHEASCYYGANTKWCTTAKSDPRQFQNYNRKGNLYYFINKRTNDKNALYIPINGRSEVYNNQDKLIPLTELRENFPNQDDLIDELTGTGQFIKNLREFTRGKIDRYDLQDSDESISVRPSNPLGMSEIIIDLGQDKDFFNLLDLSEDDIWFEGMVNSPYSDYEFMDYRQMLDDFLEGYYILDYFNEENVERLRTISDMILPEKEFNLQSDDFKLPFSKLLYELFESEVSDIIEDFTYKKNNEMQQVAQNSINKEIDSYLEDIDFEMYTKYDQISTTAANLLMWAARLGIKRADAVTLVSEIINANDSSRRLGGWSEDAYSYQDDKYFDNNDFNNYVENKLDKIIESLEEEMEQGGLSVGEFVNFRNRIVNKFKLDTWYKLPKDPKIKFKIDGFEREGLKVVVLIMHPTKGTRKLNLTEENFYNLLYHLELFDRFDT